MQARNGFAVDHQATSRRRVAAHATATTTAITRLARPGSAKSRVDLAVREEQLLNALSSVKGRGKEGLSEEQQQTVNECVAALEQDGGVQDPTQDPQLNGSWRLIFTSRPGTASPIQRTFTGVEAFTISQEVDLQGEEARVNNVVDFGKNVGYLKVQAQASTDSRPLEGFSPRSDENGEFLFGLFGKSFSYTPVRRNSRIDFQFDQAAFHFSFLPFTIPYPVPFRILGDERKGWIDVTYMNADRTLRLSRGNKGTLFVLTRAVPLKEQLRKAIKEGNDQAVLGLIDQMTLQNPTAKPARSPAAGGKWRLVWSQQAEGASALQKFGTKQANSFQIIDADTGTLQNLVDLSFVRIFANAECSAASDTRTTVNVKETGLRIGEGFLPAPIVIPLPGPKRENGILGFVDWLWLDEDVRITRGSKGSLFVHYREAA